MGPTEASYDMMDYDFEDTDANDDADNPDNLVEPPLSLPLPLPLPLSLPLPLPLVNRACEEGNMVDTLLAEEIDQLSMEERAKAVNGLRIVDPQDSDKILAKNLIQVPMDELEFGLHELHGVSHAIKETPELIDKCLLELEMELEKISKKAAYDLAKATSMANATNTNANANANTTGNANTTPSSSAPESVGCRKFRLMFLRAERFDAKNAAARLVKYCEGKLRLFGPDKLTKRITMEDLDEDDMVTLRSGYMQLLPERDRAGRAIIVSILCLRHCRFVENMVSRIRTVYCTVAGIGMDSM
jgi:hypothetical protein